MQDAVTLDTVATITDKVLAAATDWFCLGFIATADTYISRVSIEVVNTDTVNAIPVTSSNITTALAATSTVIDGARITTGSITADKIQSVYINGYTIEGAIIKGANITGSVIKSSWIDYSSTGSLTNWKAATLADMSNTGSIYYAYRNNFAKDNTTGAWITTDSPTNYVRLPATTPLYSTPATVRFTEIAPVGWYSSLTVYPTITSGIHLSNSYAQNNTNRMIKNIGETASMNVQTEALILYGHGTESNASAYSYLSFSLNGVTYTLNSSTSFSSSNGLSYSIPQGADGDSSVLWNGFNFRISSSWLYNEAGYDEYYTLVFIKSGSHSFVIADTSVFFGSFSIRSGYSGYKIYTPYVLDFVSMPLFQIF